MFKQILRFKTALMFLLGASLFCPGVFAQGHQDGRNSGNAGTINRGSGTYSRSDGHRHYYHNGNWNRSGWYGWGVPAPVLSNGILVASLPPGYTTVVVGGNTYFYGENTYFTQMPAGGFTVVTVPPGN
jgi:hypothetical protein